jgi:F0F1-type ATP synthase assembly protein I
MDKLDIISIVVLGFLFGLLLGRFIEAVAIGHILLLTR